MSSNLHARIVAANAGLASPLAPYMETVPGTNVSFRMELIPGGTFQIGSSEDERGHRRDEAPQVQVRIEPFWMGACEVTWNEYQLFLYRNRMYRRVNGVEMSSLYTNATADAVARPTGPYIEPSLGMGTDGFPAINMTQHAANKYCQWLSALTGRFYRLPTEAEWEYACRAGSKSRYSFGDDEKELERYAWFERNSDFKYQKVGRKKPNGWGLYDMHGNVAEWTLDGYDPIAYSTFKAGVVEPFVRGTRPYPHSVRGGSWKDEAASLRSAARNYSIPKWKERDPDLPKSVWHMVEADDVGFRIVRPVRVPSAEEMHRAWNNGVEYD
jgi:formylglycine-generating enzyme required for sulfatase activity